MVLNIIDRHKLILNKLELNGYVNVNELSLEFGVSVVTIRKDLKLLEERKLLFRSHGRAIPVDPYITEHHVNIKEKIHAEEKVRIAIKAASNLEPNDSIILASGTSVIEFAKHIKQIEGLTVLTASLDSAIILAEYPNIDIIQLGGMVRRNSSSVVGPIGEKMLAEFTFTKLFLGVDGIDLDYGLTTTNAMEASLNKQMIAVAQKIIVLADSSKFGKKGFGRICGFEDVDQIITDSGIDEKTKKRLEELGVDMTIV
ncbi:MAG: transcriptional regulator [Flavobacteriales bacterium CG03_land_8_20_14_0_80_35_15]|nr:DeoR/GlpR transcriptional regulator [Zetaproteobacteria bacterium]NDK17478.1 DeoR/GlpR transcriptional regulator [Flavobacteriales bacterium]OIO09324.1 MAG: transcriptional regulator [Flavobacteriaceae bacterium CG1_02_35_72]PIR14163.1 MAG: transcriptional regulator [Flavobacteriales bacterium CG11_big_fil_rev_8_21_14_0_20_35_7]PIV16088.1 MAG: transcriptional regulator [Flavobacteriales bacterium CG03_land_8_20_14_0_80_35_15]PIX07710.1 MAG: transcriptional regulator [Flavobacteriales bacter